MGSCLKTLGWSSLDGKKVCEEMLIPFDNIRWIQKYKDGTCLISVSDKQAVHVDISLEQMQHILDEHKKNPSNFVLKLQG